MAVTLPPGWVITATDETVPDPDKRTGGFVRRTYICTDQNSQYVCASGALEDCEAQALSVAQCWSQKQPYTTAR